MNITDARAHAKAWSDKGYTCVIFEAGGYSWERLSASIPPEIIVEIYQKGELTDEGIYAVSRDTRR